MEMKEPIRRSNTDQAYAGYVCHDPSFKEDIEHYFGIFLCIFLSIVSLDVCCIKGANKLHVLFFYQEN